MIAICTLWKEGGWDWKRRQISQRHFKIWKHQYFSSPQTACHAEKMNRKRSLGPRLAPKSKVKLVTINTHMSCSFVVQS